MFSASLTLVGSRCGSLWLQFKREPEALAGIPSEALGTRKSVAEICMQQVGDQLREEAAER
ncbi:MAG: hypothetical protein VKL39_01495 [Leptolyngbyaceae bacterium]|nr:hypothetical protein [Leptolyngbyaceae bacterium]